MFHLRCSFHLGTMLIKGLMPWALSLAQVVASFMSLGQRFSVLARESWRANKAVTQRNTFPTLDVCVYIYEPLQSAFLSINCFLNSSGSLFSLFLFYSLSIILHSCHSLALLKSPRATFWRWLD